MANEKNITKRKKCLQKSNSQVIKNIRKAYYNEEIYYMRTKEKCAQVWFQLLDCIMAHATAPKHPTPSVWSFHNTAMETILSWGL